MKPRQILETCLYAEDLEEAEKFYGEVLGLELIAREKGRHVFFRCGRSVCLIFNPRATIEPDPPGDGLEIPAHGALGPGHIAFAATEEGLDRWKACLQARGIEIEKELAWPHGGRSIYFRDPAGNCLEFGTPKIWDIDEADVF